MQIFTEEVSVSAICFVKTILAVNISQYHPRASLAHSIIRIFNRSSRKQGSYTKESVLKW
uniref:Uncharacterized protein n=1 Tax=Rhizophora mucronata TaxID=61149 RepID=A0A2P2J7D0_RHIMU